MNTSAQNETVGDTPTASAVAASENGDIEKMVDELASIFEARSSKITSISGLDAAYVDIFVSYSPGGRLDSQYNIILSNQSINTISRMGTPVQLTCAVTM